MKKERWEDLKEIADKLNAIYLGSPVDYAYLKVLISCFSQRQVKVRKVHCLRKIKRDLT